MPSLPQYLDDLKQALRTQKTQEAAWKIIDEYFSFMGIEVIREELWILTKGAITNDLIDDAEKVLDRYNLIFGYEYLLLFIDAVKLLHDKRKEKQ